MAEVSKIITVDWRKFGDYSAVGQLTKKIFSLDNISKIYPVQCLDDRKSCFFYSRDAVGELHNIFTTKIGHDAAINKIKKIEPSVIYVRISPNISVLEFACKLSVVFKNVPIVVHYMDIPYLNDLNENTAFYVKLLYKYLIGIADRVYVIHESSILNLIEEYGRSAYVLGNFINSIDGLLSHKKIKNKENINISYFGSIDKKMNAKSIYEFCKVISNIDWICFSIWTNSGVWGEVKSIVDESRNITVNKSSLNESEYLYRIKEADLLLLPYNIDKSSVDYLKHSFSNKLVDYLESGSLILCYGSNEIPSVFFCSENKVGIVCENIMDLENLFSSRESFFKEVDSLGSGLTKGMSDFAIEKKCEAVEFINYINSLPCRESLNNVKESETNHNEKFNLSAETIEKKLSFLIRRKFYDVMTGKQSLSATVMASILKKNGYAGFDYEI